MMQKTITPQEAKQLLDGGAGIVYLDVRTPAEFQEGRPPGAMNIPVAQFNGQGQMELNDGFLSVVAANIPQSAQIVLGCRSGQRSAMAQDILAQAGYENTTNMIGGFVGKTDPSGRVLEAGWSGLGLPVEQGDAGASGYEALRKNVLGMVSG